MEIKSTTMHSPSPRPSKFVTALLCALALILLCVALWPGSVGVMSGYGRLRAHWLFWPSCAFVWVSVAWLLAMPGKTRRQLRAFGIVAIFGALAAMWWVSAGLGCVLIVLSQCASLMWREAADAGEQNSSPASPRT